MRYVRRSANISSTFRQLCAMTIATRTHLVRLTSVFDSFFYKIPVYTVKMANICTNIISRFKIMQKLEPFRIIIGRESKLNRYYSERWRTKSYHLFYTYIYIVYLCIHLFFCYRQHREDNNRINGPKAEKGTGVIYFRMIFTRAYLLLWWDLHFKGVVKPPDASVCTSDRRKTNDPTRSAQWDRFYFISFIFFRVEKSSNLFYLTYKKRKMYINRIKPFGMYCAKYFS